MVSNNCGDGSIAIYCGVWLDCGGSLQRDWGLMMTSLMSQEGGVSAGLCGAVDEAGAYIPGRN